MTAFVGRHLRLSGMFATVVTTVYFPPLRPVSCRASTSRSTCRSATLGAPATGQVAVS
jgi:hypothetical protein